MGMFDKLFGDKSSVDRYVGNDPKERKSARAYMERRFKDQDPKEQKHLEVPKSPEVLEMLEIVNDATDALREKYGLPSYEVPAKNVHIVKKEAFRFEGAPRGAFALMKQAVVLQERDTKTETLKTMFHEMTHFKSFASLQPGENRPQERRVGLTAAMEGDNAFVPLNEAVTEELTKRFMSGMADEPLLAAETQRRKKVEKELGTENHPDIAYLTREYRQDGKAYRDVLVSFSYQEERKALHLLIDKLKERNPKTFRDKDEWFDMFAGAMFNGHLLELARVIEGTFGKGKFRELGEQKNGEEMLKFVESL